MVVRMQPYKVARLTRYPWVRLRYQAGGNKKGRIPKDAAGGSSCEVVVYFGLCASSQRWNTGQGIRV
jgi:hypothetical protein